MDDVSRSRRRGDGAAASSVGGGCRWRRYEHVRTRGRGEQRGIEGADEVAAGGAANVRLIRRRWLSTSSYARRSSGRARSATRRGYVGAIARLLRHASFAYVRATLGERTNDDTFDVVNPAWTNARGILAHHPPATDRHDIIVRATPPGGKSSHYNYTSLYPRRAIAIVKEFTNINPRWIFRNALLTEKKTKNCLDIDSKIKSFR